MHNRGSYEKHEHIETQVVVGNYCVFFFNFDKYVSKVKITAFIITVNTLL